MHSRSPGGWGPTLLPVWPWWTLAPGLVPNSFHRSERSRAGAAAAAAAAAAVVVVEGPSASLLEPTSGGRKDGQAKWQEKEH